MSLWDIGRLRSGNVGIYREKKLIHMAPPASQISRLMDELLGWLKTTELHPLIAGAIFHCEFEFIHPFADGNGRMGRLWQTLILSEWRAELAWLPLETLIHFQQERYYQVLGLSDRQSSCTLSESVAAERQTATRWCEEGRFLAGPDLNDQQFDACFCQR